MHLIKLTQILFTFTLYVFDVQLHLLCVSLLAALKYRNVFFEPV
jgi:hypothetical protein